MRAAGQFADVGDDVVDRVDVDRVMGSEFARQREPLGIARAAGDDDLRGAGLFAAIVQAKLGRPDLE